VGLAEFELMVNFYFCELVVVVVVVVMVVTD
jgi:hypothetical protein